MKKLLLLFAVALWIGCSDDDASVTETEVSLQVDHYRTTSVIYGTAFIVSENGNTERFQVPNIQGFDFLPGYTYQLTAIKRTVKNAGTNATTDQYELLGIQAQDTIAPNTSFVMPIAKFVNGVGYVNWLNGDADNGFTLNFEIPLDCDQFCGSLVSGMNSNQNITGEFEHARDGNGYRLISLY